MNDDDLELVGIAVEMLKLSKLKDAVEAAYNAENISDQAKLDYIFKRLNKIRG